MDPMPKTAQTYGPVGRSARGSASRVAGEVVACSVYADLLDQSPLPWYYRGQTRTHRRGSVLALARGPDSLGSQSLYRVNDTLGGPS